MLIVDPTSTVAPFEQLRGQILDAVRSGGIAAGTKLPTVRKLAEDLGLAPGTVARAYRELERDEIIETRGRHGTFVAATGDPTQRQAQAAATAFAERSRQLGLSPDEAIGYARAALGLPTDYPV
ncbi:GntR family transcriptional regulator [Labedella populi]|uniref:GntR family transcriptional regulator n=2 Tax=Labedella populi TaxID=2498850 RepID=A0A444QGJ5_9MICO|nr:GntR family transcriptional regulator [Labedella populi]RWZ68717.1 GntR family transcriptional regulator [Labedella populi]